MRWLLRIVRQWWCGRQGHDWELLTDPWTTTAETALFECRKCGKVEGLK